MKIHLNVLLLLLLFIYTSTIKTYGCVVDQKILFQSENTVYLLKTNVDLKGQTVKIPKGCEIRCEGGSIYNGTIEGDETILSGKRQGFIDCHLAGSFKKADIEFFRYKRNQDLARVRNLAINSDSEVEVDETDSPSVIQTITGNNHTLTLKWVNPRNGEHAAFNISGKFSLSDLKLRVVDATVNKQTHRPAIFKTTSNGYDIHFSNVDYYGNILFHKIYLDVNHFFKTPSNITFDNVKLETDKTTNEYFLIEYIDRSNFYKPQQYQGEMTFRNCSFIMNSDNAYAPASIQMPYELIYERCTFQRTSQNKVCSLETVVPNALFKDCVMTNVGFVDNNSYANMIRCERISIDNCRINQPIAFKQINTRMRVLYYSNIDIKNSNFLINGSWFSIDAFDNLNIKNCRFNITQDGSFNQGFVIYRSYPNDLRKNKKPHITIENLTFNYLGNNKNSTTCLLEFDEKLAGIDLRKNLRIKNLKVNGFGGRQFIQFNLKDAQQRLFWNDNINTLNYNRKRWKKDL